MRCFTVAKGNRGVGMKYISPFVKKINELKLRLKPKLIWNSDNKNSCIKKVKVYLKGK